MGMLSDKFCNIVHSIGMTELKHPVFYNSPIGIRFEIGGEESVYLNDPPSEDLIVNPAYIFGAFDRAMTMNYKETEEILYAIQPVCDLRNINFSTENKDWRGRTYKSDYVAIIKRHNIGFEVFDNEIIALYFTDHCHFEDYS